MSKILDMDQVSTLKFGSRSVIDKKFVKKGESFLNFHIPTANMYKLLFSRLE